MWFAGRSQSSLELCVERGYGVGMFLHPDEVIVDTLNTWRRLWKDSGNKMPRPPAFLTRSVYVGETDEQAYEDAAPYLPRAYSWGEEKFLIPQIGARDLVNKDETFDPKQEIGRDMFTGMRTGIDFWLNHNLAYIGSPDTVIRKIEETQKSMGYDVFGGRFKFGPIPSSLVEKSLRLFGKHVIPHFRGNVDRLV